MEDIAEMNGAEVNAVDSEMFDEEMSDECPDVADERVGIT